MGFLDSLKARCEVVELDGGKDWRGGMDGEERSAVTWFQDDQGAFESEWTRCTRDTEGEFAGLTAGNSSAGPSPMAVGPRDIGVYGRRLHVPRATATICRMTFSQLCEEVRRLDPYRTQRSLQALGPADYISLASTFSTFFIDAVPTLFLRNKNEARRLINLIDALCESRLILTPLRREASLSG